METFSDNQIFFSLLYIHFMTDVVTRETDSLRREKQRKKLSSLSLSLNLKLLYLFCCVFRDAVVRNSCL